MRSDALTDGASLSLASTAGNVESATTETAEEPLCSAIVCRRPRILSEALIAGASSLNVASASTEGVDRDSDTTDAAVESDDVCKFLSNFSACRDRELSSSNSSVDSGGVSSASTNG